MPLSSMTCPSGKSVGERVPPERPVRPTCLRQRETRALLITGHRGLGWEPCPQRTINPALPWRRQGRRRRCRTVPVLGGHRPREGGKVVSAAFDGAEHEVAHGREQRVAVEARVGGREQ